MLLILLLSLTTITIILITIFSNIEEKNMTMKEKLMPFECGFNSLSAKKSIFSTNFFLITIMFLMFDVEISILLPTSIMMSLLKMKILLVLFVLILTMMFIMEWFLGMLEWSK